MEYRCPHCRTANRVEARFCLDCGSPLDGTATLDPEGQLPPRRELPLWVQRREGLLGILLVLGITAMVVYSTWQGEEERRGNAYTRALTALQAHQWAAAIAALHTAGTFADAPRLLADTTAHWTQLQRLDADATRAARAGAWWEAAATLRRLAALDPRYPNLAARLRAAQDQIGPLIYRSGLGVATTWRWASADGSGARLLPDGTRLGLKVDGIAPDGRHAVYTVGPTPEEPFFPPRLDILDLHSGTVTTVTLDLPLYPDPRPVRFRNDGQGFWWVTAAGWRYYDFTSGAFTPIAGHVLTADPEYGRVLRVAWVPAQARPDGGSLLTLAGPTGSDPERVLAVPGTISEAQISPDGRLLICRARTEQGDRVVDVIWAAVLPVPGEPAPAIVHAAIGGASGGAGALPPPVTSTFLPLGPDGAFRGLVTWPGQAPLQVTPALGRDLELAIGTLQLGPNVGFSGLRFDTAGAFMAVRVGTPFGQQLDWLGFTPDHHHFLYLGPAESDQDTLYLAPTDRAQRDISGLPRDPRPLLTRPADPDAWMHTTALSHDGSRVLALRPAEDSPSGDPPGIWAIPLDGSAPSLVIPEATAFWTAEGWLGSP